MIIDYGAVTQALLGTLLTWGLTALGAGFVFFIRGKHRKLLDVSLGFAAGVMTAASYWSLLEPAIQMCQKDPLYGSNGQYAFLPVAAGFLFGAVFVFGTDKFLDYLGISSANMMMSMTKTKSKEKLEDLEMMTALNKRPSNPTSVVAMDGAPPAEFADCITNQHTAQRRRHHHSHHSLKAGENGDGDRRDSVALSLVARQSQWKRIILLVVAITIHNIPEGLAVGVSFGAAATGEDREKNFQRARNLALGIGIQNFPEGLAVSLPLQAAGFSVWRAFWYGQLSGMVEPVFGVLGAVAVAAAQPALPYALAFAAGAMVYVVADDIIPEANASVVDLESSESREVIQFHYTTWPDFGVPSSPVAFLEFLKKVRASGALEPDAGPPVVHCSAGIGRSGTFCLVDSCLVIIEKEGLDSVNIQQILLEMRKDRMGLIQTPDQLRFSYLAIIEGAKRLDPNWTEEQSMEESIYSTVAEAEEEAPPPPPRGESLSAAPRRPLPAIPASTSLGNIAIAQASDSESDGEPPTPPARDCPSPPAPDDDAPAPDPNTCVESEGVRRRRARGAELADRLVGMKKRARDAERWHALKRSLYTPLTITFGVLFASILIYSYVKH